MQTFAKITPDLFVQFEGRIPAGFPPRLPVFQSRALFSRCEEAHLRAARSEPSCYFTTSLFFPAT